MKIQQIPTPVLGGPSNGGSVSLKPILGVGPTGATGDIGPTGPQGPPGPGTGAGAWQPSTAYTANQVVQAPDGSMISRNATGTSRASFDATEEAAWTSVNTKTGTVAQRALNDSFVALARRAKNLRDMVTPSGTNDTAAVNAALAAFDAAGGGTLRIPRDNWKFTGSTGLALTGTVNPIHIVADEGTVFDMTGSTAAIGLNLGGSVTATSAALGADATKGADTITCAITVAPGDILRIQSTDAFSVGLAQPKGELVEVLSSAAGVITLKSGLWDSYAAATTTVTLMQMPRVSVEGLSIVRNSNHAGLYVQYARDILLGGMHLEGARERLINVSNVLRGVVDNCDGTDFWYSGTGTSYGLSVSSSQSIEEIGNHFRGGRHAVSHGGTFPTRDVKVIGGTFDNHHSAGVLSFDFHGNCENVRVQSATILNGLTSEAANFHGDNLTIRGAAGSNQRGVQFGGDRSCDYVRLTRCDIQPSGSSADAVGWVPRQGATAWTVGLVEIDGYIRGGGTTGAGVRIFPATSADTGSTIDRLVLSGDIQGQTGLVHSQTSGASVTINEIRVRGRVAGAFSGSAITLTAAPVNKVTADDGAVIYSPASAGFNASASTADFYLRNAWLEGTDRNYFGTGKLHMRGCTLKGFAASGGISAASASEAFISDITTISVAGSPALPARNFSRRNAASRVTTYGTAAPTAGTWVAGDVCENTAPSSGGVSRWICTVGGTPGTWRATDYAGTPTATTTQLATATDPINTTDKYVGKTVFNSTTNKLVTTNGGNATSTWYDQTGAVAHSPV